MAKQAASPRSWYESLTTSGGHRVRLRDVYRRLFHRYGPQGWWPGDGPFEVIVGAILTQSAAWSNVEKALANLKAAGVLSVEGIGGLDERELAKLLRPSGYFNQKARKLQAFVSMLEERWAGDLEALLATPVEAFRPLLLSVHGIGPETADSILLYAAGRPVFVIDAYTRRVFGRLGLVPGGDGAREGARLRSAGGSTPGYEVWRRWFEGELPPDVALFNEYHALIVRLAKEHCRKTPICEGCPLYQVCPTGQELSLR